ncbi:MAG: hypothetical protein HeimC3_53050 [Candidatus Heimdallarchaeota archaeon LC_3]|nr:MAG: hypothetical protein HeimC3_53050 [Candidatus Heimdallarchaeota archaeon LC_3]
MLTEENIADMTNVTLLNNSTKYLFAMEEKQLEFYLKVLTLSDPT